MKLPGWDPFGPAAGKTFVVALNLMYLFLKRLNFKQGFTSLFLSILFFQIRRFAVLNKLIR